MASKKPKDVKAAARKQWHINARIRELAEACYEKTRGLVAGEIKESDEYWEFADVVMRMLAEVRGETLPRREDMADLPKRKRGKKA